MAHANWTPGDWIPGDWIPGDGIPGDEASEDVEEDIEPELLTKMTGSVQDNTLTVPDNDVLTVPDNYGLAVPDNYALPVLENNALAVPENNALTVPGNYAVAIPDNNALTVPDNYGLPAPDNYAVAIPDNNALTVPASYALTVPASYALTVPDNYAVAVPENNALTDPDNYGLAVPENNAPTVPDNYSLAVPDNYTVAVPDNDALAIPDNSAPAVTLPQYDPLLPIPDLQSYQANWIFHTAEVSLQRYIYSSRSPGLSLEDPEYPLRAHEPVRPERRETNRHLDLRNCRNKGDLGPRYHAEYDVGCGVYGTVFRVRDRLTLKTVAVKVSRAGEHYRNILSREVRFLRTIAENDVSRMSGCVLPLDAFQFQAHSCLVMPYYGRNLQNFMEDFDGYDEEIVPLPNSHIRSIARQLLSSLAFLHRTGIIHGDIKTDNLMLLSHDSELLAFNGPFPRLSNEVRSMPLLRQVLYQTDIRLVDFGCSYFATEFPDPDDALMPFIFQAPEITLEQPWSFPADLWTVGCLLMELYTGEHLFHTEDPLERLARTEAVLGSIDPDLIERYTDLMQDRQEENMYFWGDRVRYPSITTTQEEYSSVCGLLPLTHIIIQPPTHSTAMFFDLLNQLLQADPNKRITAEKALEHPWFGVPMELDDGITAALHFRERCNNPDRHGPMTDTVYW